MSETKHMTGKSLCEMRGCVYISTQMYGLLSRMAAFAPKRKLRPPRQLPKSVLADRCVLNTDSTLIEILANQRIVWDAATCGGTLHYQHDEPTSFFFFRSFYFFSSRMPCLVVSLWACSCARKGMIFHLCLRRHVFESNKTHDREIALWNARMRINLDASLWDIPCSRIRSEGFTGEPLLTESDTLLSNRLQERFFA